MSSAEAQMAGVPAVVRRRMRRLVWADALLTVSLALLVGAGVWVMDGALLLQLRAEEARQGPLVVAPAAGPEDAEPMTALVRFLSSPQAEQGTPVPGGAREEGAADELNDLQRRVRRVDASLPPTLPGQVAEGVLCVDLDAAATLVDGEVIPGAGRGDEFALLSDEGLAYFTPGSSRVLINYQPVRLNGLARNSKDGLEVPVEGLARLYGMQLAKDQKRGMYVLRRGDQQGLVVIGENLFRLEIDRSERWIKVWYAGELIRQYPACTGAGNNTPVGRFHIQSKSVWPGWRAYWGEYIPGGSRRNPLGARFLATTARGRRTGWAIGIHGTNDPSSIGRRISGGCIRTYNRYAIELYDTIPIGTPVHIHE